MFTHKVGAAILSGVTASLMVAASAASAGPQRPVVVYGAPDEGTRTERVSYADLNLNQRADERKLKLRVAGAVKRVCLYEGSTVRQDLGFERCSDDAWGSARPQIVRAVARAREIALTGQSSIAATAIAINVGR